MTATVKRNMTQHQVRMVEEMAQIHGLSYEAMLEELDRREREGGWPAGYFTEVAGSMPDLEEPQDDPPEEIEGF
jgi:hypothetical protein